MLILSDVEGGTYELITFALEPNGQGDTQVRRTFSPLRTARYSEGSTAGIPSDLCSCRCVVLGCAPRPWSGGRVRGAQPLRRAGQEPPAAHQELLQRDRQEDGAAQPQHGRYVKLLFTVSPCKATGKSPDYGHGCCLLLSGLLFAAVSGRLILRSEDKLTLYEQQSRRIISELQAVSVALRTPARCQTERNGEIPRPAMALRV